MNGKRKASEPQWTTRRMHTGRYLRLKALMFNYSIPRIALKKIGLGNDFILMKFSKACPLPGIAHANQVLVQTTWGAYAGIIPVIND